jgi:predicted Zn finger-like uncharacterized protein
MAFEFTCPACYAALRVEDSSAGRLIRCGGCLTMLRVPYSGQDAPSNAAAGPPTAAQPEPSPVPDYEPPRPRQRRRAPSVRSGRGPLFWVLLVFVVLIVGGCSCCGGIYLLLPNANWRKHESVPGGFRVDLPAQVKENMPIPGMKPDPIMRVEGTMLLKRGELYAVMYWDMPPANRRNRTDDDLLDEAVNGIKEEPVVRALVRQEPVVVSGFAGREIEYVATDGGTYICRVVVADSRLYSVIGGGRFARPGNANIRRFLDSFEVITAARLPQQPPRRPMRK